MIKNDRHYALIKSHLQDFEKALVTTDKKYKKKPSATDTETNKYMTHRDSLESMIRRFKRDLEIYENA